MAVGASGPIALQVVVKARSGGYVTIQAQRMVVRIALVLQPLYAQLTRVQIQQQF